MEKVLVFVDEKEIKHTLRELHGADLSEYQLVGEVDPTRLIEILKDETGETIADRLLFKIEKVFNKTDKYNLITNNCQDFTIEICEIFDL